MRLSRRLIVFRQKRSWVDEEIAIKFLDVLKRQPSGRAGKVLVWDVFAAHRTQAVKDYAASLNITLKYIPAGQRGSLQPLDRRIFGEVKSRFGKLFHDRIMRSGSQCCRSHGLSHGMPWIKQQ
jgi:hypothetical protein